MTLRDEYVTVLEAENEQLREKVRALEDTLGVRIEVPLIFQLTRQEGRIFNILYNREVAARQQLMDILYGDRTGDDEPDVKVIDVFVCHLRKKLERFGIAVEIVWGIGYRMPAPSKAIVKALLEPEAVA